MSRSTVFWCGLCALLPAPTMGQDLNLSSTPPSARRAATPQLPYDGIIVGDNVNARSGPSTSHYTTELLKTGTRVQVVDERPGGWVAIKPPAAAFSWIKSQFVQVTSPGVGEVTFDDVSVWIGSLLNDKHDHSQVRLKRGDRVQIIGQKTFAGDALQRVSYQIKPLAGEVRWVQGSFVQTPDGRRAADPPAAAPRSLTPARTAPVGIGKSAARTTPPAMGEPDAEPPMPAESDTPPAAGSPDATLEQAEQGYEAILAKPIRERDFLQVRALYEQVLRTARAPALRTLATRRLEEIAFEEERKSLSDRFRRALEEQRKKDEQLRAPTLSIAGPPKRPEPTKSKFDGNGVLRKSTKRVDGKPTYELVSPQGGTIRYYVTPAPGLDLDQYQEGPVAVSGNVSRRADLPVPHIVVRQIEPIRR